jgi:hypothetical protein
MRHPLAWSLALLPALTGCLVGTKASKFRPARGPEGAPISIEYGNHQALSGELIAVLDTAMVVRLDSLFYLIPVRVVKRADVMAPGARAGLRRGRWYPDMQERLRLLSRFPQGLSPALQQQLLDAYGQTALRALPSSQ